MIPPRLALCLLGNTTTTVVISMLRHGEAQTGSLKVMYLRRTTAEAVRLMLHSGEDTSPIHTAAIISLIYMHMDQPDLREVVLDCRD